MIPGNHRRKSVNYVLENELILLSHIDDGVRNFWSSKIINIEHGTTEYQTFYGYLRNNYFIST